jgi:hypothetical protein
MGTTVIKAAAVAAAKAIFSMDISWLDISR